MMEQHRVLGISIHVLRLFFIILFLVFNTHDGAASVSESRIQGLTEVLFIHRIRFFARSINCMMPFLLLGTDFTGMASRNIGSIQGAHDGRQVVEAVLADAHGLTKLALVTFRVLCHNDVLFDVLSLLVVFS